MTQRIEPSPGGPRLSWYKRSEVLSTSKIKGKKEGKAAKPEEGTGALNSVMGIKWRKKRVGPAPLHPRPRENGVNRKKGQSWISLLQ